MSCVDEDEEERINGALRQQMPHHIKREMQTVDISTPMAELKRIYFLLIQFAKTKYPNLSAKNEYTLRCIVISGISLDSAVCKRLIEELGATDLKHADIPRMHHSRVHTEPPALHMFRATYGVKMPYIGGGSVILRVASENSSSTKITSLGSY